MIIRHVASRIFLERQAQNLEEQYLFDDLGNCMVLKRIIFVCLIELAKVSYSFLVVIKNFCHIKFRIEAIGGLGTQPPAAIDNGFWSAAPGQRSETYEKNLI